ncbi:hypothetical protein GHT09_012142 [Marmota monax]|uniref:Uncharacterized protein n=1 Tax=Marmota monax TaxID=9995 RepID=A0A834V072_MARMO|nr:hypothetical protein GHT09_012142 [Marmota monax]
MLKQPESGRTPSDPFGQGMGLQDYVTRAQKRSRDLHSHVAPVICAFPSGLCGEITLQGGHICERSGKKTTAPSLLLSPAPWVLPARTDLSKNLGADTLA